MLRVLNLRIRPLGAFGLITYRAVIDLRRAKAIFSPLKPIPLAGRFSSGLDIEFRRSNPQPFSGQFPSVNAADRIRSMEEGLVVHIRHRARGARQN